MPISLPLRPDATLPRGYVLTQPFHTGPVSYNPSPHLALDMYGYRGMPIYAVQSGRVFAASWNADGWGIGGGNCLIIDHYGQGGRLGKSVYAHTQRLVVVKGQYVVVGQLVGYANSTGNSSGDHCHFATAEVYGNASVYNNWHWINPYRYMAPHTFENGSWAGGDLQTSLHFRNTFYVNAGVNLRTSSYMSVSKVIRTTTTRSAVVYLADRTGSLTLGTTRWLKVYDPVSRQVCFVHSTLGRWNP